MIHSGDPGDTAWPTPEPRSVEQLCRIVWVRGEDNLRAICPCGAQLVHDDPVELMAWLYGHPDGHDPSGPRRPEPDPHMFVPSPVGVRG